MVHASKSDLWISVLRQENFDAYDICAFDKEWYTEPVCRDLKFLGIPATAPQNYPRQSCPLDRESEQYSKSLLHMKSFTYKYFFYRKPHLPRSFDFDEW